MNRYITRSILFSIITSVGFELLGYLLVSFKVKTTGFSRSASAMMVLLSELEVFDG